MNKKIRAINAVVSGVVQGVGFRPFVYRTANRFEYTGWVKNIGKGVEIHLESKGERDFSNFFQELQHKAPPLAKIEKIEIHEAMLQSCKTFSIKESLKGQSFAFISPDISLCDDCRMEMMRPSDRRYRYPFINCTNCGPRYTIVRAIPYDRIQTTMKDFAMCTDCRKEYSNPMNRRYHAQPIACPVCGPQVKLIESSSGKEIKGGIKKASELIKNGRIVAVKGLGGFHLVCDAFNFSALRRLRQIKMRKKKPLALMASQLSVIEKFAKLTAHEKSFINSVTRPIVLATKRQNIPGIAPGLREMGFMLPYTPIHYLLMEHIDLIVATSSNPKDSPIMKDENEGVNKLCDFVLTHNRPIQMRADDSVMKIIGHQPLFLRRARGYVPYPQQVQERLMSSRQILTLGGELKNTISGYKNGHVVTSQFLGDLKEYENYQYFQEAIDHLSQLFDIKPDIVVSDLHPDFHSTRTAQRMGIPHVQVQHHFAHMLAPMLEHNVPPEKKVLGVVWDGYGYGSDGKAWGGEFLLGDYSGFQRFAHFKYIPLPGGDLAAKNPWRMALSYLIDTYGSAIPEIKELKSVETKRIVEITNMIQKKSFCPLTSSCGRLFDAVSFLTGLAPLEIEFEAEAPMRLESMATHDTNAAYSFTLNTSIKPPYVISFEETIKAILTDRKEKVSRRIISTKFHNALANIILNVAEKAREKHKVDTIVLAGGVFLNKVLLHSAECKLQQKNFHALRPLRYSPNDESLSLGQMAYALYKFSETQKR